LPVGGGPDGKSPMFVKKGTNVLFNLYSMHRREDVFGPNVDDFKPERWDGLRPGWAYMPFNAGPRTCLGRESMILFMKSHCTRQKDLANPLLQSNLP
jgi:cytochrome P450